MANCPGCGASDVGGPIPSDIIHHYVPFEHGKTNEQALEYLKGKEWPTWGRFMGIEVQGVYDGVLIWKCQDCEHMWPRFLGGDPYWERLHNKAKDIIKEWESKK